MDPESPQWIRAHEIGEYVFCARAWWHRRQGHRSAREADQAAGRRFHARAERGRRWGERLMVLSLALAAAGLVLLLYGLCRLLAR